MGFERLPVLRQQFTKPGDGVRRDAREYVLQPGKRLDTAPLAGSDEASPYRRRLAASVTAEEGPVAAAQGNVAVGPFRGTVVNFQFAVLQIARERLPLIQRIAHRGAGRAFRQNVRLQLEQILVKRSDQPRRYPLA